MFLPVIFFSYSIQEPVIEYLNREIKNIEVRGVLVSKKKDAQTYVFEVKDNKTQKITKILLPETVYNSKEIYEFIIPDDYFFKVKGELKIRLGHKFDGNIEVKHFDLIPQK
jgi:hypothetical protein